ncbi:MAG TPA: AbrB/MazE/SpoVT family DNA-binding domain-containing protein [Bryobacteraceae bacterium]|nr:AbrB/MazE/SpoVT family DNA-binding domain-containing protein [Bryobacteraceae bacterium]
MRVGERGQVTIPLEIRRKFGIDSTTPVEFTVVNGTIVLKKSPVKPGIRRWRGKCADSFSKLGYSSVDKYIEDIRGR